MDQARIKARDFICANGVLQVIDQPLNPNTTGTRPVIIPDKPAKKGGKGLSSAGAAGVGIAIGVLLLGGGIVAALIIKNRRKQRGQMILDGGNPHGRELAGGSARVRHLKRDTVELEFHSAPPPTVRAGQQR